MKPIGKREHQPNPGKGTVGTADEADTLKHIGGSESDAWNEYIGSQALASIRPYIGDEEKRDKMRAIVTANPATEAVTLQVGTFTITIPPGSFKENKKGFFTFAGTIGGVSLQASINRAGVTALRIHGVVERDPIPVAPGNWTRNRAWKRSLASPFDVCASPSRQRTG